jgi:hypothetical protein
VQAQSQPEVDEYFAKQKASQQSGQPHWGRGSVLKTVSPGQWRLSPPGYLPDKGTWIEKNLRVSQHQPAGF